MTDFAALDALYPLPPEALPRQFLLAADPALLPAAWPSESLGGWHFAAHPEARVARLRAADGTRLGWAVEVLAQLGPDGDRVPGTTLSLPVGPDPSPGELGRALYGRDAEGLSDEGHGLEGAWTALVVAPSLRRVYVNPTGSVVYSPEHRAVASSHNLVPGLARDAGLSLAFDPLAARYRYTFGLTAHRGLRRLLPNHALDLGTFEPQRHWPVGAVPSYASGHEGVERVVGHSRRVLRAAFEAGPKQVRLGLTAGRDSRAALAVLRPFVEGEGVEAVLFTREGGLPRHRLDVAAARRVARCARLPHQVLRLRERPPGEVRRRFVALGEVGAGAVLRFAVAGPGGEEQGLGLNGMNGAVGRGIYWPRLGIETADLGPALFAQFARAPQTPRVLAAAQAWWDGLPAEVRAHVPTVMELLYVEQVEGCWAAPSVYLPERRRRGFSPFRGAFNVGAMLRLPVPYRARRRFQHDIVAHAWPELMAVPFNEPVGRLAVQHRLEAAAEAASVRSMAGLLRRAARLAGPRD